MTCSLVACSFQVARLAEQKAQQAASKAAAEVQREAELARKVEEAVVEQEELRLSLGAAEEQIRALQEQLVEEQAKTSAAAAAVAAGATATQPEARAPSFDRILGRSSTWQRRPKFKTVVECWLLYILVCWPRAAV